MHNKKNFQAARFLARVFPPVLCFVVVTAFLVGCDPDKTKAGALVGTWKAAYGDSYVIDNSKIAYDDNYDGSGNVTGKVKDHTDFDKAAGIIYFEYTAPEGQKGKFNAVYWSELTNSQVKLANAFNTDYSNPSVETLAEAKTKFTLDNTGDWVTVWGTYVRQP